MGGDIAVGAGAVAGGGQDFAVSDNHRADRHFAALAGGLCFGQRRVHETGGAKGFNVHLASVHAL